MTIDEQLLKLWPPEKRTNLDQWGKRYTIEVDDNAENRRKAKELVESLHAEVEKLRTSEAHMRGEFKGIQQKCIDQQVQIAELERQLAEANRVAERMNMFGREAVPRD